MSDNHDKNGYNKEIGEDFKSLLVSAINWFAIENGHTLGNKNRVYPVNPV